MRPTESGKVQVDPSLAQPGLPRPLVAHALRRAGRDVAGAQVAEARVDPLEVVVPVGLGNGRRRLEPVLLLLAAPDAPVAGSDSEQIEREPTGGPFVTGMQVAWDPRAGRVGSTHRACRRAGDDGVRAARVGRQVEDVAVAPGREDDGVRRVPRDRPCHQVAHDDPLRVVAQDHEVEHLGLQWRADPGCRHHPRKGRAGPRRCCRSVWPSRRTSSRPGLRRRSGWPGSRRTRGQTAHPGPRNWSTMLTDTPASAGTFASRER